jgi:hypothetical protein
MTPEERAAAAYERWIARAGDDLRRQIDGTPVQQAFIETVAAAIADTQEAVALGTGSAELPRHD